MNSGSYFGDEYSPQGFESSWLFCDHALPTSTQAFEGANPANLCSSSLQTFDVELILGSLWKGIASRPFVAK